jgi:hypothetical protein
MHITRIEATGEYNISLFGLGEFMYGSMGYLLGYLIIFNDIGFH